MVQALEERDAPGGADAGAFAQSGPPALTREDLEEALDARDRTLREALERIGPSTPRPREDARRCPDCPPCPRCTPDRHRREAGERETARPRLVMFTSPRCGPCEESKPTARRAAAERRVRLIEVDVTDRPDLADRYLIRSTPTFLAVDASGRMLGTPLVGGVKSSRLVSDWFARQTAAAGRVGIDSPPLR